MEESEQLTEIIQHCYMTSMERNYEFCTPEVLLLELLALGDVQHIFDGCGCSTSALRRDLESYLADGMPVIERTDKNQNQLPEVSVGLNSVYQQAEFTAKSAGRNVFDVFDVLIAMLADKKLFCSFAMRKNGMEPLALMEAVSEFRRFTEAGYQFRTDESPQFDPESFGAEEGAPPRPDFLSSFTTNMTERARAGAYDVLVGREKELERTISILCRRTKNNPVHVGDAGVGKTAIAEGLAARLAAGDVPARLKGYEIFSLEMGELLAGTKFRGDFENRMKKLICALQEKGRAILYIDEIHTVVGAGSGSSGNLDAANILKPLLAKGDLRVMGATTFEEYAKYIEKNRALARRFQKVAVEEPSAGEAVKILRALAPKYEEFHGVSYPPKSLRTAVALSVQYLPERRLPDKAIDIMDEAGVYLSLRLEKSRRRHAARPAVGEGVIRAVTAKMAGVPLESVTDSERERLRTLEERLSAQIFGQDEAVRRVCLAVKKSRAGFRNLDKPEAGFLFVGPTGVGKTELARSLAAELGENLARFDMSEYQEQYTVSRLIGSAPGYVGYENGGLLTEAVRKNPHSVILFDEIEKAHEDIYNILLQVLDYGTLTDNQGRKADFRNCLIILTSNAGARDMEKGAVGFDAGLHGTESDDAALKEAVGRTFPPEFRNRLDAVIPFRHLDAGIVRGIAQKAADAIGARLLQRGVALACTAEAVALIAEQGYSREFGARNIARTAEELLAAPLVDEVLFGRLSSGGTVTADAGAGALTFTFG